MRFSIEDKVINTTIVDLPRGILFALASHPLAIPYSRITYISMNQIRILQHLREQKAILEVIIAAPIRGIHIRQLRKPTSNFTINANTLKSCPRPISILLISSDSISIIDTLHDFGTEDVIRVGDPEAVVVVERCISFGWLGIDGVGGSGGVFDPLETLGSDACSVGGVGLVAAVGQCDAEVLILLLVEDHAAKEEAATGETSH